MNIYVGNYWVPFPASEYGGTWSVIAKDEQQCIELLTEHKYYDDEYNEFIPSAVRQAYVFKLMHDTHPHVVDTFFT
jgi:hypothetical protein